VDARLTEFEQVIRSLAPRTEALGLEQVMVQFRVAGDRNADSRELMLRMSRPQGAGLTLRITDPPSEPLRELNSRPPGCGPISSTPSGEGCAGRWPGCLTAPADKGRARRRLQGARRSPPSDAI
jgi:hypothetical protein